MDSGGAFVNDVPGGATGMTTLANGLHARYLKQLGFGDVGCAYRGTSICTRCPYAHRIAKLCDWRCDECNDRWRCPCGQTGQELRVEASTALASHCSLVASDAAFTTRANAASRSATATENVGAAGEAEAGRGA